MAKTTFSKEEVENMLERIKEQDNYDDVMYEVNSIISENGLKVKTGQDFDDEIEIDSLEDDWDESLYNDDNEDDDY